MTSDEFLSEVLNNEKSPTGFFELYETFQFYQKEAWKTLVEFVYVCDNNNITYQLAFGSLLGAIRDNGQIPWDYDVDVFVPFEEKERLIEALNRDLGDGYYFYCPQVDKNCRHFIMRLAPKGYNTEVLHVDVFYLTGLADNREEGTEQIRLIKKLALLRFHKLVNLITQIKYSPRSLFSLILGRLKSMIFSLDKINNSYELICSKYSAKDSEYCILADQFSDWYKFSNEIWNTIDINIGGMKFKIPANYEYVLKELYGDYLILPPLANRIKELKFHLKYLNERGKLK